MDVILVTLLWLRQPLALTLGFFCLLLLIVAARLLTSQVAFRRSDLMSAVAALIFLVLTLPPDGQVDTFVVNQLSWLIVAYVIRGVRLSSATLTLSSLLPGYVVGTTFAIFSLWISIIAGLPVMNLVGGADESFAYWPGGGIPRLNWFPIYTIALLPVPTFSAAAGQFLLSLPAMSAGLLAAHLVKFRVSPKSVAAVTSMALIVLFVAPVTEIFDSLVAQKETSARLRAEREPTLCWLGSCDVKEFLSENWYVALAQSNGLFVSVAFFLIFNLAIFRETRSVRYFLASNAILIANPFPLALIVLFSSLWKPVPSNA